MTTKNVTESTVTPEELDAAILELLRQAPGESAYWPDIRDRLPDAGFWPRVAALTRLLDTGQVYTVKVGGRDLITLAIAPPVPRARPVRRGAA